MANEKNLRAPFSPKEARENGSKGGKASGAAKRAKKTMKQALETLLEMEHTTQKKDGKTERVDGMLLMARALFKKAAKDGDKGSIELALKIIGQHPGEASGAIGSDKMDDPLTAALKEALGNATK